MGTSFQISDTVLHELLPFLGVMTDQRRAILESVKQTGRLSSTSFSKAQLTVLINLARSSADNSSSHGIVTVLSGATRVLAVSNVWVLSLSMVALRYMTAAYAFCDASQNPISWSVD